MKEGSIDFFAIKILQIQYIYKNLSSYTLFIHKRLIFRFDLRECIEIVQLLQAIYAFKIRQEVTSVIARLDLLILNHNLLKNDSVNSDQRVNLNSKKEL